jgi:large subunit ribosomal protein L23
MRNIIKTILMTEKGSMLQESNNEYIFSVDVKATKIDVKHAFEKHFGKKVDSVRTMNYDGKARRARQASAGRTNHWKKAIVRLKEGEKLDLV